jgi:eukaryotic-like serine/threonine-protein kinase
VAYCPSAGTTTMDGFFAAEASWLSIAGALLLVLTCAAGIRAGSRRASAQHAHRPPPRSTHQGDRPPTTGGTGEATFPAKLGRYELLDEISRGAMGRVFIGRDPSINRKVAIKAFDLAAECDADETGEAARHLLREAEAAGRLNHPDIVTIYDVGEADGLAFIAMEYLEGRRLSEFANPDALLPPSSVLELLGRTADALHYAHSRNVVHRDIKPANIMYDSHSNALKLTDFGIARLIDAARTRAGIVLGTPSFMSPEQLEGRNVNGHTDLFALGVTLFQLLTGHLPFRGNSMTQLMFVIANEPHEPVTALRPGLPACLDPILDTALAKDPARRYSNGAEMAEALRAAAGRVA